MTFDIKRIVTGTNSQGEDTIVSSEQVRPASARALPGTGFFRLWGTAPGAPTVGAVLDSDDAAGGPVFPATGATRLLIVRWPPDSAGPAEGDPQTLYEEAREALPGVLDTGHPDENGMHATDTLDWNVLLDGEMVLVMQDGSEAVLTPGACVIQRGTRHAWHNRTEKDALLLNVVFGAERKS
jgi:hypothetical protein